MVDILLSGFVTIFVIIDPLGLVPLFLAVTPDADANERRSVAIRACVIAFAILALFAIAGMALLQGLGITLGAFRVAGGLFLFWIGFELVFERRQERHRRSADRAVDDPEVADVAAFPLAIPLIAGPGAISAVILLSGNLPTVAGRIGLVAILLVAMVVTFGFLAVADRIDRFLGVTGRAVISRLLGVLLAALAVQFVAEGAAQLVATTTAAPISTSP